MKSTGCETAAVCIAHNSTFLNTPPQGMATDDDYDDNDDDDDGNKIISKIYLLTATLHKIYNTNKLIIPEAVIWLDFIKSSAIFSKTLSANRN